MNAIFDTVCTTALIVALIFVNVFVIKLLQHIFCKEGG